MNDQRDNLLGVLKTIYQWRKALRNMCLLALAGSIGLSLLLKDYYQATTVFYPASPDLANPELLFGTSGQPTRYYGDDRDLDRVAEIASSAELVDYMVDKFDLYAEYGQDSTKNKGRAKVRDIFRSLYAAQKNANDAIEISVEAIDPHKAADMANAAREKVSEMSKRLTHESQAALLLAMEDNLKRKQVDLSNLTDSLRTLQGRYGIYAPDEQGETMAEQLALAEGSVARLSGRLRSLEPNSNIPRDTIAYIKANLRGAEQWQAQIKQGSGDAISVQRFNSGIGKVLMVKDLHFQARKQLSFDLERYTQIKAVFNSSIPAVHVVEYADVPNIKSRPKRSIIVLVSVLAAFLFTLIAALIADAYRGVDWKTITE